MVDVEDDDPVLCCLCSFWLERLTLTRLGDSVQPSCMEINKCESKSNVVSWHAITVELPGSSICYISSYVTA